MPRHRARPSTRTRRPHPQPRMASRMKFMTNQTSRPGRKEDEAGHDEAASASLTLNKWHWPVSGRGPDRQAGRLPALCAGRDPVQRLHQLPGIAPCGFGGTAPPRRSGRPRQERPTAGHIVQRKPGSGAGRIPNRLAGVAADAGVGAQNRGKQRHISASPIRGGAGHTVGLWRPFHCGPGIADISTIQSVGRIHPARRDRWCGSGRRFRTGQRIEAGAP